MTSQQTPPATEVRVERGAKRVRAYLGGELVAETFGPLLVWERPSYPTYYSPIEDVLSELVVADADTANSPTLGDARVFSIRAGGKDAAGAALRYESSPIEELRDAIRLDWQAMDSWFEEDEPVFVHARNPYTRVDILASSRHILVEDGGVTIGESTRPTLLFETGLPTRYYLPKADVRFDFLEPSATVSYCPYKGQAEYWSLRDGRADVAWSYPTPLPESDKIAGLVAFYPNKVDIHVDGVE
jgi:uncharacterized protein (DUF427 family)